ncbi:MAG TPA: sugar ABC transporter permease [Candidatus Hydrothermia bacterium]|nr:sugar ABC transporter permease [Candidatus Hydrothermae bacterium]MDD3648653.1 sugar ABC transporter permease [Candidatus Hydrothermia bacterium]MDD5572233.1 sugar ABC transporter permease [Candidatus Hydrothermia bacterium]HOK22487.1 sugar ABC transporter permease [Candidatus Hydrothermia bacterium]HOL23194.1 sugar ABC transporter permease [Candidatus Hydrothermia bacterium]
MQDDTRRGLYNTPKEIAEAVVFALPAILFLVCFLLIPIVGTFVSSFYRDVSYLPREFIFFENFRRIATDSTYWRSVYFTVLFVACSVAIEMVIGIIFSLIMHEAFPGRGILRGIILVPWAIPVAVSARVWELIYNFHYGLANYIVTALGIAGSPINWFGNSVGAFFALVITDVWKTAPFVAIIILTGLQAIPEDLYAQAKVDGTQFMQRFWKITLPLLKPVIVVALLFRTIDALRVFDLVYVLTKGGPGGSTTSVSLYAFKTFVAGDFGYGSAISVTLFIIAWLFSILYIKSSRFLEEVK